MQTIRHRVYCERRRLGLIVALAFLAGYILYARAGITLHGVPISLVTGFLYAAIIGPAALATFLFLPALRALTEAVAVSRLGFACFVCAFPEPGFAVLAMPLVNATIVIGGAMALCWVVRWVMRAAGSAALPGTLRRRIQSMTDIMDWIHDTEARCAPATRSAQPPAHRPLAA